MKDGCFVKQVKTGDIDKDRLISLMVGRDIKDIFSETSECHVIGEPVLEVKDLCAGSLVRNVSFTLHAGEVLGFYGLVGAGRTETMESRIWCRCTGIPERYCCSGEKVQFKNPRQAVKMGLGMVPEDRKSRD